MGQTVTELVTRTGLIKFASVRIPSHKINNIPGTIAKARAFFSSNSDATGRGSSKPFWKNEDFFKKKGVRKKAEWLSSQGKTKKMLYVELTSNEVKTMRLPVNQEVQRLVLLLLLVQEEVVTAALLPPPLGSFCILWPSFPWVHQLYCLPSVW